MSQKYRWLTRNFSMPQPYVTLCLSSAEFVHAAKVLKFNNPPPWIRTPQADATVHHFESGGKLASIVCLRVTPGMEPLGVAGLLVHEAVHIWQEWCEFYGEDHPAREQEAYAIQGIAQELMQEYARRLT